MDVINAILDRRSIRKYLNKPVEFEKITLILKAGINAPSSGNLQDYRFIIITDKDLIRNIAEHCTEQYWIAQAPALVLVCSDTERAESYYGLRGKRLYSVQNAAAAVQNMLLAAHDLDLGACWVGSFDEDFINDTLKIPEIVRPQALITLGYPDESPNPKEKEDIDSMVFFNEYGNTIRNLNTVVREYNKEIDKVVRKADPAIDNMMETIKKHSKKFVDKMKEKRK